MFKYIFFIGIEKIFVCQISVSKKVFKLYGCFLQAVPCLLFSFWSSEAAYE